MSAVKVVQHFVDCDGCGTRFGDGTSRSAMAARIAAGIEGWLLVQKYAGTGEHGGNRTGKRDFDYCPQCIPGGDR